MLASMGPVGTEAEPRHRQLIGSRWWGGGGKFGGMKQQKGACIEDLEWTFSAPVLPPHLLSSFGLRFGTSSFAFLRSRNVTSLAFLYSQGPALR